MDTRAIIIDLMMNVTKGVTPEQITEKTAFKRDLFMSDRDIMFVIGACEGVFCIEIPEEDCGKLTTVGELENYIVNALKGMSYE